MGATARFELAILLVALPCCVVPLGPEWSDPETNDPPTIQSAVPPVGSQLAADPAASGALMVTVGLADHDTQDNLYLRWLIDYPPYDPAVSRQAYSPVLVPDGKVLRSQVHFAPSCTEDQIASGSANHRLMLAVSDRPFLVDGEGSLDAVPSGNFLIEAVWPFSLDCPQGPP